MRPMFVELEPIRMRVYGLMSVIGMLLAMVMRRHEARRKGLPPTDDQVANVVLVLRRVCQSAAVEPEGGSMA